MVTGNESTVESDNITQDTVDKSTENESGFVTLSNVPCNYYIVPCDDDINPYSSEDDENGNEIIREIGLITPATTSEFNQSVDHGLNDLIVNCIQDEKIKNELLSLNIQLERNIEKCNTVAKEATEALLEKKALIKECRIIEEKLRQKRTVDDVKLRKMKKKKGKCCADTGHNRQTYFCRFGIPYFKNKERYPAECNRDIREMNNQNQIMLYKLPRPRRFLKKDAQMLDSLILQQLKSKRIDQLNGYLRNINKQIQSALEDSCQDELLERKNKILSLIELTSKASNLNDTKGWNLKIDFSKLIKDESYHRFNSEDFERLWNLLANPNLSREDFSAEETSKLMELVTKHGAQDWDKIAQLLGTNRSAFMCFTKYVSINKKGKHIPWTEEENELLRKLGAKLNDTEKPGSIYHWWRNIRRHFPHRTYNQIHSHWTYVLSPQLKKGRFTKKERIAIEKYRKQGKKYSEIGKLMGNRSCVQIRSYCENEMSARKSKNGPWTRDEESTLLELIREYGDKNWVKISELMKTRTRTQCRLKYKQMKNNPSGNSRDESSSDENVNLRKGRWTEKENQLFLELFKLHGRKWAKISKEMKTRSRLQCRLKYNTELMLSKKSSGEKNELS